MDILESKKELKKMPFSVPDGYFDEMQRQVMAGIGTAARTPAKERTVSHILLRLTTAAAMLAAVVTGTLSITRDRHLQKEQMLNDTFFYTELMPNDMDILYEESSYGYVADSDLSDEDIIDYLIYSGIPVEQLNEFYDE